MKSGNFNEKLLGLQSELYQLACKLTSNSEDANDLLQETSLKALDNQEMYSSETNFKGWMFTLMRNTFINNYRKSLHVADLVDAAQVIETVKQEAYETTESPIDMADLHRVVNNLPSDFKVPFGMYVSGFKYREIADHLGLPIGTIKSRIFSTRMRLQVALKDFR